MPEEHHKEIAGYLKDNAGGSPSVFVYRDDDGHRPIPVGSFEHGLFSTIGMCDKELNDPGKSHEYATVGSSEWLQTLWFHQFIGFMIETLKSGQ